MTDRPPSQGRVLGKLIGEGLALALAKAKGDPLPEVSPEVRETFDRVAANRERLKACPGHTFEAAPGASRRDQHLCTACGGSVDGYWRRAYELGAEHERARAERARGG